MKTFLLLAPLAALTLLSSCCCEDEPGCEPKPRCVTGTVLANTCAAGTLIQLQGNRGGETIQFDFDGNGVKTYHHVIATYSQLDRLSSPGTQLSFTYQKGGPLPELQCQAFDAPHGLERTTLSNISATPCDEQAHSQRN